MEREGEGGGGVPIEESSAAEGSPNYTRAGPPTGMGVLFVCLFVCFI